ncbi:MAG: HU family DNA-binding protein [Bacteroidales bacterium]|nr:HU family DNA-binding protein [Bacteroidales bacterium]
MKIGKYISELLFENDFVILPDVGEFSTTYIPAKFVPELKKVESPSKVITFNESNKAGGGLLIEYIASKENISSGEAREFITNFVSEMNNSLKSGKKVELDNVGVFSMSESGQLVFDADTSINYLADSAGMASVKEPAKKSEEEAKTELDKALEDAKTDEPPKPPVAEEPQEVESTQPVYKSEEVSQPEKPREKIVIPPTPGKKSMEKKKQTSGLSPAIKWVALTVVPLLIIIIVLALNYDYLFGEKSVFRSREVAPEPARVETPAPAPVEQAAPVEEQQAAPVAETPAPAQRTATPATPEPGRRVYHIIAGSFEEEHAAIILAEELRNRGAVNARVFPVNPLGFYRVSYGFYYDLNEAEQMLKVVQEDVNASSWILHR